MKKLQLPTMFLLALLLFSSGCSTLRKVWTSEETQAAIAADVQKLAGTDKLAERFDAAEERAELMYAFTWLAAQKQGITETDARDWLAGRSGQAEDVQDEEAEQDVDALDFAALQWEFGGVDGSKAKLDSPRLSGLKAGSKTLSYKWEKGLSGWGLSDGDAGALACFFVEREDGTVVGGKFDWVSTSRSTRGLENVFEGYAGWSLDGVPNPCKCYFTVVSKDGRKRSNVIGAEWKR